MNNKLEVIGIDHGWSMMKTIAQVFVTGVTDSSKMAEVIGVSEAQLRFVTNIACDRYTGGDCSRNVCGRTFGVPVWSGSV